MFRFLFGKKDDIQEKQRCPSKKILQWTCQFCLFSSSIEIDNGCPQEPCPNCEERNWMLAEWEYQDEHFSPSYSTIHSSPLFTQPQEKQQKRDQEKQFEISTKIKLFEHRLEIERILAQKGIDPRIPNQEKSKCEQIVADSLKRMKERKEAEVLAKHHAMRAAENNDPQMELEFPSENPGLPDDLL